MGVRTAADEHKDSAKAHVSDAIVELGYIIIDRCEGYDEFNSAYLRNCLSKLIDVRDIL